MRVREWVTGWAGALALSFLVAPHALAQHPDLVTYELGYPHEWRAASLVLDEDGSVSDSDRVPHTLRESLKKQVRWTRKHHGDLKLKDGYLASREGCRLLPVAVPRRSDIKNDFSSVLLLSDVAVTATVSEIIPGFERTGYPSLLLVLDDVAPLRNGPPVPSYALLPVGQYVVDGQLFCGDSQRNEVIPSEGSQIVVIGGLDARPGTVWLGSNRFVASLGLVEGDERVLWRFMGGWNAPTSLARLRARIDEAVVGGLFDVASRVAALPAHSPERWEFSEMLAKYHEDGCRIREASIRDDGSLEFAHVCGDREERVVE